MKKIHKIYLIIDGYILKRVLEKIKMIIGIEEFVNIKLSIDTEDKLDDKIVLKNIVVLVSCVIKFRDKFYLDIFLVEALVAKKMVRLVKCK